MRKWGDEVTTSRLCAPSSSSSSRYVSFLPLHFLSVSAGLIWTSVIVLSLSTFLLPIESARETVSFFCRCCANDIHFNDDYANEFGNANSAAGRVDRLWTTSSFTWCPFWLTSGSIEAVKGKTTSTSESGKRRRRASEMSRGSWLKRARHLIHAATFVMSRDFTTHDDAPESIARAGLHSFSLLYFILIFFCLFFVRCVAPLLTVDGFLPTFERTLFHLSITLLLVLLVDCLSMGGKRTKA